MIPSFASELLDLGYDTIPLHPNAKRPWLDDWPRVPPVEQWRGAPDGCNGGIRGGGAAHVAFLDADDPPTSAAVQRYLAGLGYDSDGDYPIIRTLDDNRHMYVRFVDGQPGRHYHLFRREFGIGEFRYGPGSFVVAPGSVVDGKQYELLEGDLRQLPRLDLADITEIVELDTAAIGARSAARAHLSRRAKRLLNGEVFECYASRSEADAALVTSLVNTGHDFASVLTLFATWPTSGKFTELRSRSEGEAVRYLRRTFDRTQEWAEAHESPARTYARNLQQWAAQRPWPGATGNSKYAVFMAHCEIAKQAGVSPYAASARRLAEVAGVAYTTALAANAALLEDRLIFEARASKGTYAMCYRLGDVQDYTTYSQKEGEEVIQLCTGADAFRTAGLTKSGLLMLTHLSRRAMSEAELTAATGKHRTTVQRTLAKMQTMTDPATGEVLRLVERCDQDGTWRLIAGIDLDAIARAVGTEGIGAKQKERHKREQKQYKLLMQERQRPKPVSGETQNDVDAQDRTRGGHY